MASEQKLFDLFGEFTSQWPSAVKRFVGILGPGSGDPDLGTWLAALNSGTQVRNSRVGAGAGRVSLEAQLTFDNAQAGYAGKPDGFPFVLASMPDVEFRIQTVISPKFIQFFASASEGKAEVVIEGLPVEILLPIALIQPPEAGPAEVSVGEFTPGVLDGLKIIYRRFQPTSVFVHIRLLMNEDNEFVIRSAVPVNFGKCLMSDLPVKALHDFTLIPSPTLVAENIEWIRHSVEPWFPDANGPLDGLFAFRSVDVDEETAPIKDIAEALNKSGTPNPEAEFVLDDLVVPFFSPYVIPIPRHITVGVRRRILQADDIGQVFAFSQAPVQAFLSRDPAFGLILNSLFYKSLPSEDLSTDLGLTFSAVIFFGENQSAQHGFEISLSENYTPLLGYRRGFSSTTGLPDPGTGAAATINALLHWEIAGSIFIDIMGFRGGYSLGRALGEGLGFGDCFEFTGDLFVSMPPTGGDTSLFRMRSLDGQKAKFALQGLGWKQGSFHFEGLALPDGVAIFFGPVKIIIQEFGLAAESGASYLSFSGGLGVELPSGFDGAMIFRRLRFRVSGNPNAPAFKLDGIFIELKFGSTLRIEAGGFYTEKELAPNKTLREFGLTGTVAFELGGVGYMFALDILAGSLKSPADSFDFFMFQIVFRGSVPIAWFELRGVRVLFARNMQPKLEPVNNEAYQLRYYNWYKATNPISVSGDRRLAAWQAQNGSWALGIGLGASFAQLGRILELDVFFLKVSGDDESGALFVAEALLLQNPKPVAFIAIQWDGKNDQFSMLVGVNLTPRQFMSSVPAWVDRIAKLTGTLFICNRPVVVALGRLSDTRTWFSLTFDFDVWARFFIQFGLCFEYSEAPGGGKGFGLIVRLEGTINGGILRVDFNAGFGFVAAVFNTASNDYAASIWIEAGVRIVLFFFLRFGISARAEFRNVGSTPSRGEIRAEFRLETPWFLPDVTWTFEVSFGSLEPAALAASVSALRSAMAIDAAREKGQVVHLERIDPTWSGNGVARTWSVNELRTMTLNEAARLSRFAANADAAPVATDSSISIEFSVAVNDLIGVGGAAPGYGNQKSNDLGLSYDLIGVAVRRRARFGSDKNWYTLQEKIELNADFSDPSGVDLSGSFSPQHLTMFWAPEQQIDSQTVPKKLKLNSKTPYDFQTKNQEIDEETVKNNPAWPCCGRDKRRPYPLHEIYFRDEMPGADIVGYRLYSESQSRFRFLRTAYAFPVNFGSYLTAGTVVALMPALGPGAVFRAELDQDAAVCYFRLLWTTSRFILQLAAFDGSGNVVGRLDVAPKPDFQDVVVPLSGPARRLEGRIIGSKFSGSKFSEVVSPFNRAAATNPNLALAIDRAGYVGLRDYLDYLVSLEACDTSSDEFANAYSGKGALSFLPNYEYEVALRTRITVSHPSKPAESVEVSEYVYFKTKGLPGLNATQTVGDEVAPYVQAVYEGGRGALYREEPVAVVFKEDFHVAVPLALRPPGTSEERNTLLVMKLVVRPDIAQKLGTPFTTPTPDWIVANRKVVVIDHLLPYTAVLSKATTVGTMLVSSDPFRERLAEVTMRPTAFCPLPDPLQVVGTALIAMPQGEPDPLDPAKELWPANAVFTGMVKPDGTGFVARSTFAVEDLTAFTFSVDAGPGGASAWSVSNGEIVATAGALRRFAIFGEASWNYVTVELSIAQLGAMAGIGVGLPAGNVPSRGLFAVVQPAGAGRRIAIYRRTSGAQFDEIAQAAIPDATADGAAPVLLSVTAYDDKLRASVGDTMIEVQRDELREGRLSLVAQGQCRFSSLCVAGLDIYRFPFQTSRYRSFTDHIGSFQGTPDVIEPNALGPGTTIATTAAVMGATSGLISSAMQPAADARDRQKLFEEWVRELGLPLRDEVNRLEISRFVSGAATEFFLIESPEPLDFTEEISLELARRDQVISPHLSATFPSKASVNRTLERKATVRRDLARLLGLDLEVELARLEPTLLDVARLDHGLELRIHSGTFAQFGSTAEGVLLVEAVVSGDQKKLHVYSAPSLPASAGAEVILRVQKTDEIEIKGGSSSLVSRALAELEEGTFALAKPGLKDILGIFTQQFKWTPLPAVVLQDATALRALVIPASGGALSPLSAGTYRLRFTLDRRRWQTTDPPDDLNRYQQSSSLQFSL